MCGRRWFAAVKMKRERALQSDENRGQHRALTPHVDHHWPSFLRAARCDVESARDYCAPLVPTRVYHRPVRRCPDRAANRAWIATGDSARLAWSDALGSVFAVDRDTVRSEEHTSELQSQFHLVCR